MTTAFQSREEQRRAKELDEARKAGTAPAEKDEEGKDINPHIPQYISKAPWYLNQERPGLRHQRYKEEKRDSIYTWYKRGVKDDCAPKLRFQKGACVNCGSTTHSAKDCVERPRQKKAKYTQRDLMPDEEVVEPLEMEWDAKRDRYAGYDNDDYKWVIRDYEYAEVERKRRKEREIQQRNVEPCPSKVPRNQKESKGGGGKVNKGKLDGEQEKDNQSDGCTEGSASDGRGTDTDSDSDAESDVDGGSDDEDIKLHDFDTTSAPVECKDERSRINTKNLRIREDTAKYLLNLDLNSAFYDPKSRSMRDNPFKHLKDDQQGTYKGENALLKGGDVQKTQKLQLFAWEAYKHGQSVHYNAQPTQLEFMFKEHTKKKEELENKKAREVLKRYGGEEHLQNDPRILYAQTEAYVEYSRDGTIARGRDRCYSKSKYDEDVYVGSHTSVWGSHYDRVTRKWGFSCCKQTDFRAECTGRLEDNVTAESIGLVRSGPIEDEGSADGYPSASTNNALQSNII